MTSIVSTVESSDDFLIVILPFSTSTASEKLRTMLLSTAIAVELSEGVELLKVGAGSSIGIWLLKTPFEVVAELPVKVKLKLR